MIDSPPIILQKDSALPPRRQATAWKWGVFAVALNALILFVVIPTVSGDFRMLYAQNAYTDGYDILASNLVEGKGYRMYPDTAETLMREPGYPLLLAGIFKVFGKNFAVVKAINLILVLGAAYFLMLMVRMWSTNPILTLGAPLLYLFHPGTLIAESRGGVEALFTFCLALFMLTFYRACKSRRVWDFLLCGVALGLTLVVRSTPLLFPLVLLGYLWFFERAKIPALAIFRNLAVLVMAAFVVLSPWIIRNYLLTSKFVPTASVLGVSAQTGLYINTHHSADSRRVDREASQERNEEAEQLGYPFQGGYYQCFYSSGDELKFSNYLVKKVIGEYRKSPMLFLKIVGMNLFNFWCGGKNGKSEMLNLAVQLPYVILALLGFGLCVKHRQVKSVALMGLLIFYIIATCVPILAQARYSVPIIPYVSVFACIALVEARRRLNPASGA